MNSKSHTFLNFLNNIDNADKFKVCQKHYLAQDEGYDLSPLHIAQKLESTELPNFSKDKLHVEFKDMSNMTKSNLSDLFCKEIITNDYIANS